MKQLSKTLLGVSLLLMLVIAGCSKSSNAPSANKTAKLTFTVSNTFKKPEGDHFEVTVSAADEKSRFIDWNVNGEKRTGTNVSVGVDDFNGGKTIIIESASNFFYGSVNFGGFEFGSTPFTVTWKIEVNGSTIEQGSQNVVKDMSPIFSKSFQLNTK